MSRIAVETRFDAQRSRILKAAASCFNQKGFSGTSLKDVADRLGLTDAALYYYVKNKEELVYQCYLRAAELGKEAMDRARTDGQSGLEQAQLYLRYHLEIMVGEQGPVAIMSEIPSLKRRHRNEVLEISRRHSAAFEAFLTTGITDGSIVDCNVRMTGNAVMGSINWVPKWYHGDRDMAKNIVTEFPVILTRGLGSDFGARSSSGDRASGGAPTAVPIEKL
ncbi:MAG: TetR/AcrR family transcriptional regulator [Gammaproteobacteria bacterium]|nr:TetR/AcrR family transcriptional regulator [Gammaproteobacteria bacterium]